MILKNKQGFTLIELIVAVVLIGILGALSVGFIKTTFDGLANVNAMSEMSGTIRTALITMEYDIKSAIRNSVRIATPDANHFFLELVRGYEVVKYDDYLKDVTGNITTLDLLIPVSDTTTAVCNTGAGCRVMIRNTPTQSVGQSVYRGANNGASVITQPSITVTVGADGTPTAQRRLTFSDDVKFPAISTNLRVTLVEKKAVSYVCDLTTNTLTKYWNYEYSGENDQPTDVTTTRNGLPALNDAAHYSEIIASNVTSCGYSYVNNQENAAPVNNGVGEGNGILAIYLRIKDPKSNASMTVFKEIFVDNNKISNVLTQEMGSGGQVYEN